MMKYLLILVAILSVTTPTEAMLRGVVQVDSVQIDPDNPDVLYIELGGLACQFAVSTNAGDSFQPILSESVPTNLTDSLIHGSRQYTLFRSALFRSDDGGATWTNTASLKFLSTQIDQEIEQEKEWFREQYGHRIPVRSVWWHRVFWLSVCAVLVLIITSLRDHGQLRIALTVIQATACLLMAWVALTGFYEVLVRMMETQWPAAYWQTGARVIPTPKLVFALSIAARPMPLLVYLLFLWFLLPGSLDVLYARFSGEPSKKKACLVVTLVAGAIFIVFNVLILFVGHFLQ